MPPRRLESIRTSDATTSSRSASTTDLSAQLYSGDEQATQTPEQRLNAISQDIKRLVTERQAMENDVFDNKTINNKNGQPLTREQVSQQLSAYNQAIENKQKESKQLALSITQSNRRQNRR
jgi:hypothetical protein